MLQLAVDNVGPDQEFSMAMRAEAGALFDSVLVDDTQRAIRLILRAVVRRERESVKGV